MVIPHAEGLGNAAVEQLKALADYAHFSVSVFKRRQILPLKYIPLFSIERKKRKRLGVGELIK